MSSQESSSIYITPDSSPVAKGEAPLLQNTEHGKTKAYSVVLETPDHHANGKYKKAIAVFDLIVRIIAAVIAIASTVQMSLAGEILPFFTQFFQFNAGYDDFEVFQFFVFAMGFVAGYLVLSIPLSIVTIIRPHAVKPRLLLFILDTVAATLNTTAASAAVALDYLAHNGNTDANWLAFCNQFTDFCQTISAAVVLSYVVVVALVVLIGLSALALRKH